jgi:spore germination protein
MFFFKLLVDKYSEGNFDVKTSEEARAAIQSIRSEHKIKVSKRHANINIEIYGIIREYTGKALTPEIIKEVEKKLEDQVERESLKLLKRFQELGIDPVGLGELMKQQHRDFDFKKWEDEYKQLTFDVKCDVVISETGVIE